MVTNNHSNKMLNQIRLYRGARFFILLITIFTAFNVLMLILNQNFYFLVSALLPQVLTAVGLILTEFYATPIFYIISIFLNIIIVLSYLLIYFLSKNRLGGMIAALTLFALDCVFFLYFIIISFDLSFILDIFFHLFILYELILGVISGVALKKHPLGITVTENQIMEEEQKLIDKERIEQSITDEKESETDSVTYDIPDSIPLFNYYGNGKVRIFANYEQTEILFVESGFDLQLIINGKVYQVLGGFNTVSNFNITANYHGVKYTVTQRKKFLVGHLTLYANDKVISTGRRYV